MKLLGEFALRGKREVSTPPPTPLPHAACASSPSAPQR
jgi:hypothetical protein